jgi:hypothetical protein
MYRGPPTAETGNTFTTSAPAATAVRISVGVRAPGMVTRPRALAWPMRAGSVWGETMKSAPASAAAWTSAGVRTVPTPRAIWARAARSAWARTRSKQPGVLAVTSTARSPASRTPPKMAAARSRSGWRTTPTRVASRRVRRVVVDRSAMPLTLSGARGCREGGAPLHIPTPP